MRAVIGSVSLGMLLGIHGLSAMSHVRNRYPPQGVIFLYLIFGPFRKLRISQRYKVTSCEIDDLQCQTCSLDANTVVGNLLVMSKLFLLPV